MAALFTVITLELRGDAARRSYPRDRCSDGGVAFLARAIFRSGRDVKVPMTAGCGSPAR